MGRLTWSYQVPELLVMLLLYSQVASYLSFSSSLPASSQLCHHDQRIALLQFKYTFSIVSFASSNVCDPSYPITKSWKKDVDCCSWDGVKCDNSTGHVIGLDLSCSWLQGSIPSNSTLFTLPHLQRLLLSYNNLSGPIPDGFGKLQSLTDLDLSLNSFNGWIPSSIFNLPRLSHLGVGNNVSVGNLPSDQVTGLSSLEYLWLSGNQLNGTLPSWLFSLPSLRFLSLRGNQFTGQIPEFQSRSLEFIDLSKNELHGPIPNSLFELANVTIIDLSSNKLSGVLELDMFSKLQRLLALDLSGNGLSLLTNTQVNTSWPSLMLLGLSSCNMTHFPTFVSTQERLGYLNLSHNLLRTVNLPPLRSLTTLDLRSNLIEGPLPVSNATLPNYFLISGNKLTGEIPSSICNITILYILDLSNNNLTGKVPECLGSFSLYLSVLSLQMNSFHGPMPGNFSRANSLSSLNFNGNLFEGPVSKSLIHCKSLEVLDLGNNNISDDFPKWLESLPNLQVLILRSNRFHGPVGNPISRNPFQRLRILDLSHNSFTGLLPTKYLANLNAMRNTASEQNNRRKYMGDKYGRYQDSVTVTMKGLDFVLVRILTIFTTIDLSCNKFEGQIPDIIGNFGSLKALNLSHNNISGHIPSSLGNMAAVESLDLSANMLQGEIPSQLTNLNFLEVLNLSHNLLEGPIPLGKQFNTFTNDSYLSNSELCGFPLSKKCRNEEEPVLQPPPSNLNKEDYSQGWFNWKIAAVLGYGCGLVLGCSMAYIVFSTGKPWWFVKRVDGEWTYKVTRLAYRHKRRKVL